MPTLFLHRKDDEIVKSFFSVTAQAETVWGKKQKSETILES